MLVKFLRLLWIVPICIFTPSLFAETRPALKEELLISASEGEWTLKPGAGPELRVECKDFETWLGMEQKEGRIEIRSRDQLNKAEFGRATGKPHSVTVLVPPNMNVDFHLMQGSVTVHKLNLGGFIAVQRAKVLFKEVGGSWGIDAQRGDVSILDSQGHFKVDSYGSKVEIKNFNGNVDLSNFIGDSIVEKTRGFISLNHGAGTSKILSSSGNLQFEARKGSLFVTEFDGRAEGQAVETGVSVTMLAESEVHIRSQSGRVQVTTPSNSGASLNLATQDGELVVPSYFKVSHDNLGKSLRSKLHGDGSKGSIFIRTQEGAVIIR